jgi:hypothetical protein
MSGTKSVPTYQAMHLLRKHLSIAWIVTGFTVHCSTFTVYKLTRNGCQQNRHADFRIEPVQARHTAAEREHRSLANRVEVLIRDYCGRNRVAIPEQDDLFTSNEQTDQGT